MITRTAPRAPEKAAEMAGALPERRGRLNRSCYRAPPRTLCSGPRQPEDPMLAVDFLVDRVRSYHPTADVDAHPQGVRLLGTRARGPDAQERGPVLHPSRSAWPGSSRSCSLDTASVCAGLLHDVVEDTPATDGDIEREFGNEIAFLVDGVTKLGKINFSSQGGPAGGELPQDGRRDGAATSACCSSSCATGSTTCARSSTCSSRRRSASRARRWRSTRRWPAASASSASRASSRICRFKYLEPEAYHASSSGKLAQDPARSATATSRACAARSRSRLAEQGFAAERHGSRQAPATRFIAR